MRSILLAPVLLVGPGCLVPTATVSPTASQLSIDGSFGANVTNTTTISSDFDDLGLDEEEFAPNPRADLEWVGLHLSLSTMLVGFDGEGTAQGDIEIGNEIITAGADVSTDLDMNTLSGVLTWDVMPIGFLELGIGVGVTLLDIDVSLEEVLTGTEVATDETLPVPLLAARLAYDGPPFGVAATLGFMDVEIDDADLSIIDLDVYGEYHLFGGQDHLAARIVLGYRMFEIDGQFEDDGSDIDADAAITGPYIGFNMAF